MTSSPSVTFVPTRARNVTAVLGPTNTGKTHLAIERMLGYETGIIGLPLRLLAREVYDKVVDRIGAEHVALVTGEEKIKPESARYWVSTVEAMPQDAKADFVAIDEVQLAADAERGHVFTERLLNARGTHETLLLGSGTMREAIFDLLPGANFISRPRLSKLTYAGQKKISRLPRRTAVVAFSAADVYQIAELIRRQRGGAAVVLGALSPRTRNAQVALYQSGEVDFLVATDAVGMGLNLDVDHVAFAGVRKFDGEKHRFLSPVEIAQIAGRAGRHLNDGTFGVTADVEPFESDLINRLENHEFEPVRMVQWRNGTLDFSSLDALLSCLKSVASHPRLAKARTSDDSAALEMLAGRGQIRDMVSNSDDVRLLWDVCQIPDYRKVSSSSHGELVSTLFEFLKSDEGKIPEDWFAEQVARDDRTDGDLDTLSNRLANLRTWTFVSHRDDWLKNSSEWQEKTRELEDRLSDALHEVLTQRFVDKRTSALMRTLRDDEELFAEIGSDGAIKVENHYVGRLEGLKYIADAEGEGIHGKAARHAAARVLENELAMRVRRIAAAKNDAFRLTTSGKIMWQDQVLAEISQGDAPLKPALAVVADDHLSQPDREKVQVRLSTWLSDHIKEKLRPLSQLAEAEDIAGLAKGFAFRLTEAFGIVNREAVADEVRALDQNARAQLRRFGVRFGAFNIFMPLLLKPAAAELIMTLWGVRQPGGLAALPAPPRAGLTSLSADPQISGTFYRVCGFHLCGPRAVRIDMLERLSDMIRPLVAYRDRSDAASGETDQSEKPGAEAAPDDAASEEPSAPAEATSDKDEETVGASGSGKEPSQAQPELSKATEPNQAASAAAPAAPAGATGDGGFYVQPEMLSILGCSTEEMGAVLTSLGFRLERKTVEAETAGKELDVEATASVPEETASEAVASEAVDETGGHQSITDASASHGVDLGVGSESADQPGPVIIEIWRPRRKHADFRQKRRDGRKGKTDAKEQGERDNTDRNRSRKHGKSNDNRDRGKPKRGDRGKQQSGKGGARTFSSGPQKRGGPDPDSPFAALSQLKKELEARDNPGRSGK